MRESQQLRQRLLGQLRQVPVIDCHEHLQREREFPTGEDLHFGRLFSHYANCDLVSAGMPPADMQRLVNDPGLAPRDRFALLAPWYERARNTGYHQAIRRAIRQLWHIDDLRADSVDELTAAMRRDIGPGWTRRVFDAANIDYAMVDTIQTRWGPDLRFDCFMMDLRDCFTTLDLATLGERFDVACRDLDDYLALIDRVFAEYGHVASAFKVARAYDRPLRFAEVPRSVAEAAFNELLAFGTGPGPEARRALEDFLMHYLCRRCGDCGLRMKFHTGYQEGNGNRLPNSRALDLGDLFLRHPQTDFDLYHISWPWQDEAIALAKMFPNVTLNFCWVWIINPAAARRCLDECLDAVPANKVHGFGGDSLMACTVPGHLAIAREGIADVLAGRIERGILAEAEALAIGRRLLRENALENFDLDRRRAAFEPLAGEAANPSGETA